MLTRLACGSRRGNKQALALVAGAPDSLFRRLIYQLVARSGGDSQNLLLLGLLSSLLFFVFLARCLLLRISGALLAALVFALQAHFLVPVESTTAMAASVHTHTNSFLDTGRQGSRSWCSNPLMRFQCQSIFGEECTSTLLLHGIAIEDWVGADRRRRLDSGGRSEVLCSRRTVLYVISVKL